MRWLLASLFLSAMYQTACGSSSKPVEGVEKGPCYPNLTCNAGLTCLSDLCVYAGPSVFADAGASTGGQMGGTGGFDGGESGRTGPADLGTAGSTGGNVAAGGGISNGGGGMLGAGGTTAAPTPDAGMDTLPDTNTSTIKECPDNSICFKTGQAQGLFTGYGWVDLGRDDSLTSPACDTGMPISLGKPCATSTVWSKPDALCLSGLIPALPASPTQVDYDNNWGVGVGVNAREPSDAIGDSLNDYTAVSFTISGSPSSGLRAILHRKGDPDGTTYCVDSIKSDTPIKLTKFNTKCWGDPASVFLTEADLPLIDKVGVRVPSTSAAIAVTNLCLSRLTFFK